MAYLARFGAIVHFYKKMGFKNRKRTDLKNTKTKKKEKYDSQTVLPATARRRRENLRGTRTHAEHRAEHSRHGGP